MEISPKSTERLQQNISLQRETFCSGLFLSARWFVLSQVARSGLHLVVLPDSENAEYCTSDLYNLIEGDRIFFLPASGRNVERSNYKSTLGVQRTAAIGKLLDWKPGDLLVVVSYPEALSEGIPPTGAIRDAVLKLSKGQEIDYETLCNKLIEKDFSRVDFVSAPGQYAIRGSLVDIFSYADNDPYRISFWGDEIEKITSFDCNTQLSKETLETVDIVPDLSQGQEESRICDLLPDDALVWLDASDMYKDQPVFGELGRLRRVFFEVPIGADVDSVRFNISPQPVFGKNFELLTEDIRTRIEGNYSVFIYGEKKTQLERLRSIFAQNDGIMPQFIPGKNIHSGFIDHETRSCHYSDHEIFDRFHRVAIRRTVEKSEQLTLNDLSSFNIGDYIVHIDHGVGIFGGLVRIKDDMGRVKEVVKLMYKDGDVVFVSVHALHKISRYKSEDQQTRIQDLADPQGQRQGQGQGHRQGTHPALRQAQVRARPCLRPRQLPTGGTRILLHV